MNEIQELQAQHYKGRAQNTVQSFLIQKLLLPKIYLDADWSGWKLDVLAIDRAGAGDVHGVRFVLWEPNRADDNGWSSFLEKAVLTAIEDFSDFPGHFRYLTVICTESDKQRWIPSRSLRSHSLAPDGVGRVGLLYVNVAEIDAEVEVLQKPERFRSSKNIVDLADRYVADHVANWEVRE
jgi:hypothetical protein